MKKGRLLILGLCILFLLLFCAMGVCLKLGKSDLDFLSRATFVLIREGGAPLVFSFEGDSGFILLLPKDLRVQTTRGFGEYELGKVYPLGELEGKGSILLRETLQETLSAPVFGFFKDSSVGESPELIPKVFLNALLGKNQTDLSKADLVWLYLKARKIDKSKVNKISYGSGAAEAFKDRRVREESLSFEVLNATDHSGFAQASAKLLDHCGGRVVRIADAPQKQQKCEFLVSSKVARSYTVRWLKLIYPCAVRELAADVFRADVSLVLGEEYWKKWSEKW